MAQVKSTYSGLHMAQSKHQQRSSGRNEDCTHILSLSRRKQHLLLCLVQASLVAWSFLKGCVTAAHWSRLMIKTTSDCWLFRESMREDGLSHEARGEQRQCRHASLITQACEAHCTHLAHLHQSWVLHPPSPAGKEGQRKRRVSSLQAKCGIFLLWTRGLRAQRG